MTDCCSASKILNSPNVCPRCGHAGKLVEMVTPKALLTPDALAQLDPRAAYHFCSTVDCPVVYHVGARVFEKSDVMVRVFQKETSDPLPVCYCFAITRQTIAEELRRNGESTVVQRVTAQVRAGRCACELRNPQGTCCLGNLAQMVVQTRHGLATNVR